MMVMMVISRSNFRPLPRFAKGAAAADSGNRHTKAPLLHLIMKSTSDAAAVGKFRKAAAAVSKCPPFKGNHSAFFTALCVLCCCCTHTHVQTAAGGKNPPLPVAPVLAPLPCVRILGYTQRSSSRLGDINQDLRLFLSNCLMIARPHRSIGDSASPGTTTATTATTRKAPSSSPHRDRASSL